MIFISQNFQSFMSDSQTPARRPFVISSRKKADQAIVARRVQIFLAAAAGGMRGIPGHAFGRIAVAVMMANLSRPGELA
jgi:hypothetical protein